MPEVSTKFEDIMADAPALGRAFDRLGLDFAW